MRISVLGGGNIGGALGGKWAAAGHQVFFGLRQPRGDKAQALLDRVAHGAQARFIPEAVAGAEVVLFALPARAMTQALAQLGDALAGKTLIDATNNVGHSPMHQLEPLRQAAPGSPLFRAFSNLGWENFADPAIGGVQVDLFYCGEGDQAQPAVAQLIADIGLRPVYLGGLEQADLIDALTRLWFTLALQQGRGRHLAFKLLQDRP